MVARIDLRQYPRLRRMVQAPPTGGYTINYSFTPKAARIVEQNPEVLLQARLYRKGESALSLYEKDGQALAAVQVRLKETFARECMDNICVLAPEELSEYAQPERVQLADEYPSPFLPFDLDTEKHGMEKAIARGNPDKNGCYISKEGQLPLYAGSNPFAIYQLFHFLTRERPDLASRISSILDVGGGVGTVSFIISQLLPRAQVRSIEIDLRMVDYQQEISNKLKSRWGYDFPNINFTLDDILSLRECGIEDFDAAIGWFPIRLGGPSHQYVEVFQQMPKGALLFLLFQGKFLLFPGGETESLGFRRVPVNTDYPLPATIYERI